MLVQIFEKRQKTLLFPNKEMSLARISSDVAWSPCYTELASIWSTAKKLHSSGPQCRWTPGKLRVEGQQWKESFNILISNANKMYSQIGNFLVEIRVIGLVLQTGIVEHEILKYAFENYFPKNDNFKMEEEWFINQFQPEN